MVKRSRLFRSIVVAGAALPVAAVIVPAGLALSSCSDDVDHRPDAAFSYIWDAALPPDGAFNYIWDAALPDAGPDASPDAGSDAGTDATLTPERPNGAS